MDKVQAKVGNHIRGDEWPSYAWAELVEADDFIDNSFPGCDFRLKDIEKLKGVAVNIKVTGKPRWFEDGDCFSFKSRCKIEIVGDGEPSVFFGGWLYHKNI